MVKYDNSENPVTAVGIIIPVDWDEGGTPVAFAIATYGEQEYLLDSRTATGQALMKMMHQKIRVTGTLGPFVDNRRIITVNRYERIK